LALRSAAASVAATAMLLAPSGDPLRSGTVDTLPVRRPPSRGLFDTWVEMPAQPDRHSPRAQQLTRDIRACTGWSQRKVAAALGVTHPTVRALEEGRSSARVGDLYHRLLEVHDVIERIFLVAGGSIQEADRLLSTAPDEESASAVELLKNRQPSAAYLAALGVLHPRRRTGMMQGRWPAEVGDATTAIPDDSSA
jgi:transcriptional regulator with XRE-family HTH domain